MASDSCKLVEFGRFSLDTRNRFLLCDEVSVQLPLKSIELLCLLVENAGRVVTKEEIWQRVWPDAFVEETNLTHSIYVLRKTLRELDADDMIETVPRRGYRFAGEILKDGGERFVIERHSVSRTTIEQIDDSTRPNIRQLSAPAGRRSHRAIVLIALFSAAIVVAVAGFYLYSRNTSAAAESIRSIAVLPLRSVGESESERALSFGVADSLIRGLGRVSDVRVVSASAVAKFADMQRETVDVGREFGVDAVMDGTLQKSGGKLRVSLRLIRIRDGSQIWSGLFTESESEVFRMQEAIASQSAQALATNLKSKKSDRRPTDNPEAYNAYLRGDYLFRLRGVDNVTRGAQFFRQAVELDPNFARAWAGLAAALAMGVEIDEAEKALSKSLELDPELAEAHATRGFIRMFHYWDWNEAERSLTRAIELDPNSVEAHHWLGVLRSFHGRLDEAKIEMHQALDLDPLSMNLLNDIGQLHYFAREYEAAEQYCLRAKSIDPDYSFDSYLGNIYLEQGRDDEAFEVQVKLWCSDYDSDKLKVACTERARQTYHRGSWKGILHSDIKGIFARINGGQVPADRLSREYAAIANNYNSLGNKDKTIEFLNRSLETKNRYETMNFTFPYLKVDPQYDGLRDDPRFKQILLAINL